ncbi:hypothetical protein Q5P01_000960 [Channa striata]|uniref:MHC class I-like antigen recognition-like domain-containing protein n=1 Tax=Channa striata TaxID=64152 RepID=A0AA88LM46_CHASR|nr:hypothetical protein Q5P01_000960 [Channa striata]
MTTPVTLLLLCQAASAVKHTMTFYLMISSGAPNVPDFMIVADFEGVRMAYYDSSMKTPQARHDWVRRLMQDDPQHWERIALDSMRYEQLLKGETESFKQNSSQTGGVHVTQQVLGCEWDNETEEVDDKSIIIVATVAVVAVIIFAVVGFIVYKKKKAKRFRPPPEKGSELSEQLNPEA